LYNIKKIETTALFSSNSAMYQLMTKGEIMANLKRVFYTAIGLALKGKKKVEEAAKNFVENNKTEDDEGKKFIGKVLKNAETTKDKLSKKVNETLKTTISKIGFITHKEADTLKNEIEKLKSQLQSEKEKK
jgi:polyhydroxyalkanoate synthesis regulator phasin